MNETLDEAISKAKRLAQEDDNTGAMLLANHLVREHPQEMKAWLLRAYLNELANNYFQACADATCAIELNPMEPHLFYSRGRYQFQIGNSDAALADFDRGLELCDYHKNNYYQDELYFWRAETLIRLGRKHEALKDLTKVDEDFKSWTDRLRTKKDLLQDCTS